MNDPQHAALRSNTVVEPMGGVYALASIARWDELTFRYHTNDKDGGKKAREEAGFRKTGRANIETQEGVRYYVYYPEDGIPERFPGLEDIEKEEKEAAQGGQEAGPRAGRRCQEEPWPQEEEPLGSRLGLE